MSESQDTNAADERRLWIGNLDTRITEYQLLKILQKCGNIEKFDVLFHKSGPLIGQPRGYAFVTYMNVSSANKALDKLNRKLIGSKTMVVRLAKNINYDEIERPKPKIDIPVLAAGGNSFLCSSSSSSSSEPRKISKEMKIQALEAKIKMLEKKTNDFEVNKTVANEVPLIHKYQFNKQNSETNKQQSSKYQTSKSRYTKGPYQRRHKR